MKDPAFLFYPNDFLSGTYTMEPDQIGKFIVLLCLQHSQGELSEKEMLKVCGKYDEDIFSKFVKTEEGNYYNKRLKEETDRRKAYSESRSRNRRKGKPEDKPPQEEKPARKKNSRKPQRKIEPVQTNNEKEQNTDIELFPVNTHSLSRKGKIDFKIFWDIYDKKVGNKTKIKRKWDKLQPEIQKRAIEHIRLYVLSTPDKQFRLNPETYLNNRGWNNEIINQKTRGDNGKNQRNIPGVVERELGKDFSAVIYNV